MNRTVDEKLKYNRALKTPFAYGYRMAVWAYRSYPKASKKRKSEMLSDIDYNKHLAVNGDKSRQSVQYAKGFMCGVRDAANERKSKQKRR